MSVKKFKPLGEMVERSTLAGGIYVLASDYGAAQAREAELKQRLDTAEHQREVLAQAIADATHKAGIVADGAALDGPTLLMVLNDLAERHGASPGDTVLPPDDQDEINRLHAEFIAVDEPNNEQVMTFQDASYALGLKRGRAHEAALQQRLNEADQRVADVESASREMLRIAGIANQGSAAYNRAILNLHRVLTKDSPEVGS